MFGWLDQNSKKKTNHIKEKNYDMLLYIEDVTRKSFENPLIFDEHRNKNVISSILIAMK